MWERADLRGHEPCKVCTPGDAGKSQGILIFFSFGPKKEKKISLASWDFWTLLKTLQTLQIL